MAIPAMASARTREARLLGRVQHPRVYDEVLIESCGVPIALSVWRPAEPRVAVAFVPGTGVHPLFYEEFLDGLSGAGCGVVGVHPQAHGKSPRVRRILRWSDVVHNAVDASRWARTAFGCPVVMIGSSQGALVALIAAASDAPVTGVVAHNVFDPADPSVIAVTRLGALDSGQRGLRRMLAAAAALAPRLPVPITAYLDPSRVFGTAWTKELFELDPLSRPTYPLRFLADLVAVDSSPLYDGRLRVPVVVLTANADPLFPLRSTQDLARRLVAPSVRLVLLDTDRHLILNESLDLALPAVLSAVDDMSRSGEPSDA